jgi:hypothetical protein
MARAIERAAFGSGRAVSEVIIQATIMATQSAAKATPQSKKNRKVIDYGRMSKKRKAAQGIPAWAAYGIEKYKRGIMGTVFVKSRARADKLKVISRRGIAKRAWTRELGKIGGRPEAGKSIAGASALSVKKEGSQVRGTTYENRIKYLPQIAPQSAAIGLAAAASRVDKMMRPKVSSAIRSAARGVMRVV